MKFIVAVLILVGSVVPLAALETSQGKLRVQIMAEGGHHRIAGIRDAHQRAGLRIALAESHEIEGIGLWHDRQICLKISATQSCGMRDIAPGADRGPDIGQGFAFQHSVSRWHVQSLQLGGVSKANPIRSN